MKIILLDRKNGELVDVTTQTRVAADSAILPTGRPLFLPDFAESWDARAYLTYRVSRLGKTIRPKFADRYYDAISLTLRLIPNQSEESAVDYFFDNCLATGPFITMDEAIDDGKPLLLGGKEFHHDPEAIKETIAQISRYATLKNGDLLLTEYKPLEIDIKPKTDVTGEIYGHNFKVALR